jgi:hypothetical protein
VRDVPHLHEKLLIANLAKAEKWKKRRRMRSL